MTQDANPQTAWSPILEGEAAERAAEAVAAVAGAIGEGPLAGRHATPGLAAGEAGAALLFEYLDRARPGTGYGDVAVRRIERAGEGVAAGLREPSLYGGFTGVSWVLEHLQGGPSEEDDEDLNEEIDAALLAYLRQTPWPFHYDLTGGLVGFGVYALERLPRPSAVACLEQVVERLAEMSEPRPGGGLAWFTPLRLVPEPNRPWYPQGYENLGMAHGLPGVVAVLARTCAAGVAVERARPLLEGAVSWLLAQKLPPSERSVFPYAVGPEVKIRPARTAWCYGDGGIALALLAAGRAAGRADWEREALDLARTVARRPVESCGVEDAGLCHGAAGLGHLLNRLHQATGDPELREAARAWLGRALGYREPGRGIGGFLSYTPPPDDPDQLVWNEDPGFLTGSSGIALALLAGISAVAPDWDRVLLVSGT
ncbi:MAG: lanthionine synthetase C family protein [Thermoanaerobaculia bacterium]